MSGKNRAANFKRILSRSKEKISISKTMLDSVIREIFRCFRNNISRDAQSFSQRTNSRLSRYELRQNFKMIHQVGRYMILFHEVVSVQTRWI